MTPPRWTAKLFAIVGVALLAATAAACLPDNPYQRWQLVEHTLFANATWSYERVRFDPAPVDVAILGSSRSQLGLSAPRIAARLAALGVPAAVANLSVIEDGRNLEWAIADELFRHKAPRVVVVLVNDNANRWGHPGFKYVAPAAAIAAPPVPFLHNSLYDLAYLPYRQLTLAAAAAAPVVFGLRDRFDAAAFAAKPVDYSTTQTLADGKRIDMTRVHSAAELRAERRADAPTHHASRLPAALAAITDRDNRVYVAAIARLARAHGARLVFVFLPTFEGPTAIEDRAFYDGLGPLVDLGDLSREPALFQSFAHLNHAGAAIASDRLAAVVAPLLSPGLPASGRAATARRGEPVARPDPSPPRALQPAET